MCVAAAPGAAGQQQSTEPGVQAPQQAAPSSEAPTYLWPQHQPRPREAGHYLVRTFSPEDYGADSYVWYAAQGNGGLMYFANLDGVLEFDGRTWRTIDVGSTVVRSLAADSTGRIFVGKRGDIGVLEPDSVGRLAFRSLRGEIPEGDRTFGDVWQMLATPRGVYFNTPTHVFRWSDGEGIRIWRGEFHKAFAVEEEVYVRDFELGLVRLHEDGSLPVPGGQRFADEAVTAMLPFDRSRILLATSAGELLLYDGTTFSPFVTEADAFLRSHLPYYYAFAALPGGRFAFGTRDGGVVVVDREGRMVGTADRNTGLRTNKVYYILPDHEGGLWLTHEDGISRWEPLSPFSYFDESNGLTGNVEAIRRHDGDLYAATSSGLYKLVPSAEPRRGARFELLEKAQTQCWDLASIGDRLLAGCTTAVFEIVGDRVAKVAEPESAVFSLLASDRRPGLVYLGLKDGVVRLQLDGSTWAELPSLDDVQMEVRTMVETADGTLWIGGADQLLHVDPSRTSGAVFSEFGAGDGLPKGYANVYQMRTGIISIARDGVREVAEDGTWRRAAFLDEIVPGLSVREIREDYSGQMWVRTSAGIGVVRSLPGAVPVWEPIPSTAGWDVDLVYPDPEGYVWLGGVNGIARFDPALDLVDVPFDALVRRVATIGSDSLLYGGAAGEDVRPLTLRFEDNAIRFTAGAATFDRPPGGSVAPQFQYLLEGFDESWSDWTDEIHKDYTNLPEGEYRFSVRARSAHGSVSPAAAVAFTILPPWYRAWWAYGVYVLFGLGFLYGASRWRTSHLERRNQILEAQVAERSSALEQKTGELEAANSLLLEHERALRDHNAELEMQAQRLEEMDAIKSRFFANISHEFRTPLTLILGPLEDALQHDREPHEDLVRHIEPMHRNASRLLALINQLLDLSRLESGRMTLSARRADLVPFLRRTAAVFESRAARKEITLNVDLPVDALYAYFDAEKLERVIINLLSNAFKFTPKGGAVGLRVALSGGGERPEQAVIVVEDTGPGIPPEELTRIFDRFYTVDRLVSYEHEGSGIGLALARELMEMHGGTISVESEVGTGARFTISLPLGMAHLDTADVIEAERDDIPPVRPRYSAGELEASFSPRTTGGAAPTPASATAPVTTPAPARERAQRERATILVVEDNDDLRAYLRSHLTSDYHVEEAVNGLEGLERAKANPPHLIISDVMMPRMDGYALCRAVKSDDDLRHIPVVLLTAKASDADKVEGLALGADDYLFKPFNKDELLIRVENLIEIRRMLRRRFGREVVAVEASEIDVIPADAAFLEQATAIVESHVGDANFGVDWLADEAAMSPRQLQRKIKELTGLTPSGFIRSIRLQRAAQLLDAGAGNVSEIAAAVGFNDAKHFSKLFRQVFGAAPSQYEG